MEETLKSKKQKQKQKVKMWWHQLTEN